jgi:hypothetical protein
VTTATRVAESMFETGLAQVERPQKQRSLIHFSIGDDRIPKRVYHIHGYVKKARK